MADFFKFRSQLEEAKCGSKSSKREEKLDPVGKADADIDNDGDVDSSDEYLKNRRKAISKSMKNEDDGPCWKGYVQVGTKMKDGKEVPNCVPMEEARKQMAEARRPNTKGTMTARELKPGKSYTFYDETGTSFKATVKSISRSGDNRIVKYTYDDNSYAKKGQTDQFEVGTGEKTFSESVKVNEAYDTPDYGPIGASEMKMTQLHFIKYAADEIIACLESGCVMPEWYQNKVAKVEGEVEGLLSYMKGKKRKAMSRRYSGGMYEETSYKLNEESDFKRGDRVKIKDNVRDSIGKKYRGKSGTVTRTDGNFVDVKVDRARAGEVEFHKRELEPLSESALTESFMDKLHFITKKERGKTLYLSVETGSLRVGELGPSWVKDPESANAYLDKKEAEKVAKMYGGKVQKGLSEEAKSGDKEAYRKFFNKALKKFGVDSPAELKGEKEKEFYDYVDKNWKSDKEQKNESVQIDEKLKPSDDVSKWIEDFYQSDAPQFKGKSKEERREMAVAAWLDARREAGYDVGPNPNEETVSEARGSSKDAFKRREMEVELGDEPSNSRYTVVINGKGWKTFTSKRAAQRAANTIKRKYGKNVEIRY